ncbi:MAG: ATP-binding protein [Acidobacteriota bacterium]
MQGSSSFVQRTRLLSRLSVALEESPICALVGARQTGKTTLAKMYASGREVSHYFDLETAAAKGAMGTAEITLGELTGLVVIDEIQRMPDLFRVLRPLADRDPPAARFLVLGSASPGLVKGVSESLAGRVQFVQVPGFSLLETGPGNLSRLWLRGGFPRSYLASSDRASLRWRDAFISTFLERDIPQLGIRVPGETLRRFWNMLCHYHGQIWNASDLARSMGMSEKAVRHYVDILAGAHVVRILPPWHENIGKRQTRSPKVYVRDSGLLHALLRIETLGDLRSHPKHGASWEGFAIEQVLSCVPDREAYFWGTHAGAEIDLLVMKGGRHYGFEFKCTDAPSMTRSLHVVLEDLKLHRAWVVYPGELSYPIHERVQAIGLAALLDSLDSLT